MIGISPQHVSVCALAGSYSSLLHPHSEEAEHSFTGTQRLVDSHHRRRQGQFLTFNCNIELCFRCNLINDCVYFMVNGLQARQMANILFFFFIPSHCLVPVCVAAEQRIMLSAAAFSISSDRGELLRSNVEFLDIQKFCHGK